MDTLGTYGSEKKGMETVSNLDTKYLIYHVGTPLTKALAEIVEKRPSDPIEYLSRWLYNYKAGRTYQTKEKERLQMLVKLEVKKLERQACIEEEKRLVRKERKESFELKQRERLKREGVEKKQQELAGFLKSPEEKDEKGQTALHRLIAAKPNAELMFIKAVPLLFIERDVQYQTPRDVAQQMGYTSNVRKIDECVFNLFKKGDIQKLDYLLMNSYEHFQAALDLKLESQHLPDASEEFILTISYVQEKIANIFSLIQEGDEDSTERLLESQPQLAICKNNRGQTPLHVAILCENVSAVRLILGYNPEAANMRDNSQRIPLHYACALSEIISGMLSRNQSNDYPLDLRQNTPADYKKDPTEILSLKEFYIVSSPSIETESLGQTEPVQNTSEETVNEETVNEETINEETVNEETINEETVNEETINEETIDS